MAGKLVSLAFSLLPRICPATRHYVFQSISFILLCFCQNNTRRHQKQANVHQNKCSWQSSYLWKSSVSILILHRSEEPEEKKVHTDDTTSASTQMIDGDLQANQAAYNYSAWYQVSPRNFLFTDLIRSIFQDTFKNKINPLALFQIV